MRVYVDGEDEVRFCCFGARFYTGFLEKGDIINYSFKKSSTDKPDWEMMARNVLRGISFPGWLGITVLLLVLGLYQIS